MPFLVCIAFNWISQKIAVFIFFLLTTHTRNTRKKKNRTKTKTGTKTAALSIQKSIDHVNSYRNTFTLLNLVTIYFGIIFYFYNAKWQATNNNNKWIKICEKSRERENVWENCVTRKTESNRTDKSQLQKSCQAFSFSFEWFSVIPTEFQLYNRGSVCIRFGKVGKKTKPTQIENSLDFSVVFLLFSFS